MSGQDLDLISLLINAKKGEFIMEYQIESERGFQILGSTVYTANTLLPMDPARFSSLSGEPLGDDISNFEVPDDSWVWGWSRWYVDMTADVDDQGWCYSWRFGSKRWSGRHRFMRSFVRQRIWKRPRIKSTLLVNDVLDETTRSRAKKLFESSSKTPTVVEGELEEAIYGKAKEILEYIRGLRNDREKVKAIIDYITDHPDEISLLVDIRNQLMATINFPVSKRSLITKLSESEDPNCQLFVVAPSADWKDEVLRHGQPQKEPTTEDQSREQTTLNSV